MPVFAFCFVFTTLASIALPGLCGFIGEFLVLAGSWAYQPVFTAFAVLGAIIGAWYMLRTVRRLFFGPLTNPANQGLQDLTPREMLIIAPLLVAMLWLGVGAQAWLRPIQEGLAPVREALPAATAFPAREER
jgi:NADH-quinone oxidoreductase subunit M